MAVSNHAMMLAKTLSPVFKCRISAVGSFIGLLSRTSMHADVGIGKPRKSTAKGITSRERMEWAISYRIIIITC
jgi:hypothetical protein